MSSKFDIIASRYAKSLKELVINNDKEKKEGLEKVYSSFESFIELLNSNKELNAVLSSPVTTEKELIKLIKALFAKSKTNDKTFEDFILICAKHKRLKIIRDIFHAFTQLKNEVDHVTELLIESADEMSDQQVEKIKMIAKNYSDKKFLVRKKINTDILGGFVLEFDSYRIDASLKTKLFEFKNILKEVA